MGTLTKRQRETAKRRAEGRCLACGKAFSCHHCYAPKADHANVVTHKYAPLLGRATCADCGQRANAAHAKARASKRAGFDGTVSVRVD